MLISTQTPFDILNAQRFLSYSIETKRLTAYLFCSLTILLPSACIQQADDSVRSKYQEIGWEELKPDDEKVVDQTSDLPALEDLDDWYAADKYSGLPGLSGGYYGAPRQTYSVGVVSEMDGQNIRLPGFIVPIEFEAENLVTEFFLVPYFGACFHKPPPPPNQTVYVSSEKPIEYESIYDPVWIMGAIKTEQQGNNIATAAYSMDFHVLEPYFE